MNYILKKALLHIKYNKKNYIIFFIQTVIGMIILSLVLTVLLSMLDSINRIKAITDDDIVLIGSSIIERKDGDSFTEENYNYILNNYGDKIYLPILYKTFVNMFCDNEFLLFDIIFIDDVFMKLFISDKVEGFGEGETAYIGSELYEKLIENITLFDKNVISKINQNEIILGNGKVLSVKPMSDIVKNDKDKELYFNTGHYVNIDESKFDLKKAVILPIEAYESENFFSDKNIILKFKNGTNSKNDVINEITEYLKNFNKNYNYTAVLPEENYYSLLEQELMLFIILLVIGIFVLLIISFGLIGILLIFTNRRTGEVAVVVACGAFRKKIYAEFLLSTFCIIGSGGILGSITGCIIALTCISYQQFNMNFQPFAIIICVLLSLLITIIGSILPIMRVRKLKPMEILQSL
ncbi:MAG: hypothetical protein K0S55_1604 [Clostridia bacterium]|nr:hypothetical protein [Clostridia bacterium]